jgi:hypothetical protein
MADGRFDLQKLQVATPCYERWEAMKGDARVRFCGSCKLSVYNVREMTAAEVEALWQANNGRLCVKLYRRWDGTVLTKDCPVGRQRARVRVAAALLTAAAFLGVLLVPMLLRLGSSRVSSLEGLTFEERMEALKNQAYDWPVIGVVLEKVSPRDTFVLGGM